MERKISFSNASVSEATEHGLSIFEGQNLAHHFKGSGTDFFYLPTCNLTKKLHEYPFSFGHWGAKGPFENIKKILLGKAENTDHKVFSQLFVKLVNQLSL